MGISRINNNNGQTNKRVDTKLVAVAADTRRASGRAEPCAFACGKVARCVCPGTQKLFSSLFLSFFSDGANPRRPVSHNNTKSAINQQMQVVISNRLTKWE